MADTTVRIGENTVEHVAFRLMQMIANVENRQDYGHGDHPVDREWILRTYRQCWETVKGSKSLEAVLEIYNPGPAPRSH